MMNPSAFETKKRFVTCTLSRCVAAMYPRVCRLEYHLHDNGDEVVVIRCMDGYTARVDVTGLELRATVDAVLAEFSTEVA